MKYDDAEYCFLNFETSLPTEAGGTHTGMYLAWAALNDLLAPADDAGRREDVHRLKTRAMTGRDYYFTHCDGKFTQSDLGKTGQDFTAAYYEKYFVADYERVFKQDFPDTGHLTDDFCSIADTWDNFDRLRPVLDQRFTAWRRAVLAAKKAPSASVAPPAPGAAPANKSSSEADPGDPATWLERAAQHIEGRGVPQDFAKAADAFTKAAELGSADGMFNLGVCYQNGDGRPKDAAKALHWFGKAADGGHAFGLFMLGQACRSGKGMPQDIVASNALMALAHQKGVAEAGRAGIIAGAGSYAALAMQFNEPGQVLKTLRARQAASASNPAAKGTLTTIIGGLGPLIWLLSIDKLPRPATLLLLLATTLCAIHGAWHVGNRLGHGTARRVLMAGLAAMPMFALPVCAWLLYGLTRPKSAQ